MTAMGMSRLAFLASPPMAVTDSKPTRMRMATVAWMNIQLKWCGLMTEPAVGWDWNAPVESFRS